jgi:hypothetical protein
MFISNKPDKLHPILIPQQQPSILLPSVHHQYVKRETPHTLPKQGARRNFPNTLQIPIKKLKALL